VPPKNVSLWHMDSEVYLLTGGFVLGMAAMMLFLTGFESVLLAMCVPAGIVPGAIAVAYGVVVRLREIDERKADEALRAFAAYLKPYRRIGLDDLARNTGRTRMQAEHDLGDAIARGYLRGVIDRAAQEFVTEGGTSADVFLGKCPHCGGIVNRWAFPEEAFTCPFCERPVSVPAATPSK